MKKKTKYVYELYPVKTPASKLILDRPITLKEMQDFVEGFIEISTLDDSTLIFNEEGLLENLLTNPMFPEFVGNVIRTKEKL